MNQGPGSPIKKSKEKSKRGKWQKDRIREGYEGILGL